jgi:hypothetical protein
MEELSLSDLKPLVASTMLTSGRLNNKEALIEMVLNNLKGEIDRHIGSIHCLLFMQNKFARR